MFKRVLTLGLAGLLSFSSPSSADKIDDIVNSTVGGNNGEWRNHLWSSIGLTIADSFLLEHARYSGNPESLSAKVRVLETTIYQGVYTPIFEDKITPGYALFDIIGIQIGYNLFPRLELAQPLVDKLADITEEDNLKKMGIFTAATMAVGYTFPGGRDLFEIDLKEQIKGNNFWKHVSFFSYYTFRTSMMLDHAGYRKRHTPESLAWRVAYGLGIGKELVVDSLIGDGPSIRDAAEDGLGVGIGYVAFKLNKKGVNILPFNKGIEFELEF